MNSLNIVVSKIELVGKVNVKKFSRKLVSSNYIDISFSGKGYLVPKSIKVSSLGKHMAAYKKCRDVVSKLVASEGYMFDNIPILTEVC